MERLYKRTISEAWYDQTRNVRDDMKDVLSEMKELADKLAYIRELLATQKIDPDDSRIMKAEYSFKLERLEVKLSDFKDSPVNIHRLLDQGVGNLFRIDQIFEDGNPERKRVVIGSMFPEKLTFDGFKLRTVRVNEVARIIYSLDEAFHENKTGQKSEIPPLSCLVTPSGLLYGCDIQ